MNNFLRVFSAILGLIFIYSLLTSSSGGRATVANQGNTGAPNENTTCGGCHGGGGYGTITPVIQVYQAGTATPATEYVGGTVYDISVVVNHSAGSPLGYGFQMTCLTTPGNTPIAGYFNLNANVKQKTITSGPFSGRTYVEHNGVMGGNAFTMQWTAPPAGTGTVKFYTSGNAVNLSNNTNGDNAGVGSFTLPELVNPLGVTGFVTSVSCNGGNNGAINITASGGSLPYSYNWGGGITTEDRTGLSAGTYTVTITDNSGATTTATYTIIEPTAIVPAVNAGIINCNGGTTTVNVTATGGTPPYTGTGTFTLGAGAHNFPITDANGCAVNATITLTQPTVLNANVSATTIPCNGGTATITVSASGGTPPYIGTGTFTVPVGTYSYTVTDANNCTAQNSVTITQPAILAAATNAGTILCNGGTTTVNVVGTGGTAPYTGTGSFLVGAGTYNYVITDVNGCTANTSATITEPSALVLAATSDTIDCAGAIATIVISASGGTAPYTGIGTFTQNSPGTYNYVVTDANNCTSNINAVVVSTSGLTVNQTIQAVSCNGLCDGSITLNVVGGTAPFVYSWSNGTTGTSANNLCAGTYQQSITDATGCTLSNTYIVTEPDVLVVNANIVNPILCFGEFANVQADVTGGTAPYTYSWGNGNTTNAVTLSAGNYSLSVTDNQNCTTSMPFTLNQPSQILAVIDTVIDAVNGVGGEIQITVSGGTAPYTYQWDNGDITEDVTALTDGLYTVTITDANGCITMMNSIIVNNTVGIGHIPAALFNIYPNPASNKLSITMLENKPIQAVIYNEQGQEVMRKTVNKYDNSIDIQTLPSAKYVLWLLYQDKLYPYSFVK